MHELLRAYDEVSALHAVLLDEDARHGELFRSIHPDQRDSARNLLHYTKLRKADLRPLQDTLRRHGLSSLSRSEASVLSDVTRVLRTLGRLTGQAIHEPSFFDPSPQLEQHTSDLLGMECGARRTRIMVTAPSAAAEDPELIRALLEAGMDILRIDCARDTPEDWKKMTTHVRYAEERTGRSCLILCELTGPKLRTATWGKRDKGKVTLNVADRFYLTAYSSETQHGLPSVPCAAPALLGDLQPGHAIWFDNGKFGGEVLEVESDRALIRVLHAPEDGGKLKGNRSINVPDTQVTLPALSPRDLRDLDTITEIADLVGQSYIRDPSDVTALNAELARRNATHLGIILKIETPGAFAQLPAILLSGMSKARLGVMVERGDLAIEMGFDRLAEVQEEILWMCEAAHAPVILATQVLERMTTEGQPTRAEVIDAAMSARAECVLLQRGPYVVQAVQFLNNVLSRMEQHQSKTRPLLRPLTIASWLDEDDEDENSVAAASAE